MQYSCHDNNCFLTATALLKTKITARRATGCFLMATAVLTYCISSGLMQHPSLEIRTDFFFPASSLLTSVKPAHKYCSAKEQTPMRASISIIISMAVTILLIPEAVSKIASSCWQRAIDRRMSSSFWYCQYQFTFFQEHQCLTNRTQRFVISLSFYHRKKPFISRAYPLSIPITNKISPDESYQFLHWHSFSAMPSINDLRLHTCPHAFAPYISLAASASAVHAL